MEGVGARLGRISNRYVPTTVFTGPVRRWKKKWVHVAPSKSRDQHSSLVANGRANVDELSAQLLFYRWTPQTKEASEGNGRSIGDSKSKRGEDEPPVKKFKYIPVVVLEEQKNENREQIEDETNEDETTGDPMSKRDRYNEEPDINYIPKAAQQNILNCPSSPATGYGEHAWKTTRPERKHFGSEPRLGFNGLNDENKSKSEADQMK